MIICGEGELIKTFLRNDQTSSVRLTISIPAIIHDDN
jgi:hypothetical protein